MKKMGLKALVLLGLVGLSSQGVSALEWQERSLEMVIASIKEKENGNKEYEIQWGDTLSLIATALDIDIDVLAKINKIEDKDLIIAGSKLFFNEDVSLVMLEDEGGDYIVYNIEKEELVDDKDVFKEEIKEIEEHKQEEVQEEVIILEEIPEWVEGKEEVKKEIEVETTTIENEEVETTLEEWVKEDIIETEEVTEIQEEVIESEEVSELEEVIETEELSELEEVIESEDVSELAEDIESEEELFEETVELEDVKVESEEYYTEDVLEEVNVAPEAPLQASGDPYSAFNQIVAEKGVSEEERVMWESIITRESGWNVTISNQYSGAYGLPQALPGNKMASHGADWETNPYTQLNWMFDYMIGRYGSIKGAYDFWESNFWY